MSHDPAETDRRLLVKKDEKAAVEIKKRFEKIKETFPYQGEMEAETEWMKRIEEEAGKTSKLGYFIF